MNFRLYLHPAISVSVVHQSRDQCIKYRWTLLIVYNIWLLCENFIDLFSWLLWEKKYLITLLFWFCTWLLWYLWWGEPQNFALKLTLSLFSFIKCMSSTKNVDFHVKNMKQMTFRMMKRTYKDWFISFSFVEMKMK